jgi:hypothetical protein
MYGLKKVAKTLVPSDMFGLLAKARLAVRAGDPNRGN